MLNNSENFKKLAPPEQAIFLKLANRFQEATMYLFLDPQELTDMTGLGTREQWQSLLLLQETQSYIKGQMGFVAQIGQRKSFQSLLEAAMQGNVQASKQVQELSGIMNSVDNNKIIIMHRIPRANEG